MTKILLWHDDVRKPPICPTCKGVPQIQGDGGGWDDGGTYHTPPCQDCDNTGTQWTWVRDNDTAKAVLSEFEVYCIDLDHDLGGHEIDPDSPDAIYYRGDSEDNGMKLVEWMIRTDNMPHFIRIHSWNVPAAERMVKALRWAGHTRVRVRPYEAPE